jgi:hypothetical protein
MAEAAPGFEEEIKAVNDGAPNFAPEDEAA